MSKALDGIRVVDFTHDQAGPACTQMLAWLGADVIKIERPPHGDRARRLWYSDRPDIDSYFFLLLNSNKRSTVINLKTDEGKEIARRLVREADVVAENLGPGVMDRLGLGYEAVKALNPRAIYASVKGFGSFGPYSGFKCFEMIAQATSGGMSVTGYADRPPVVTGVNVGDAGTGMHLTIAILAALVQRQQTGRGQLVEVAMQEAVLNITRVKFTPTLSNGWPLERMGNRSASGAYADLVRCAGVEPFDAMVEIIGREGFEGRRALQYAARARQARGGADGHHRGVDDEARQARGDARLRRARHSVRRRPRTTEVRADEHLRERGTILDLEHPTRGRFSMIGSPLRLSDPPLEVSPAPLFGEHTEEVLRTLGGYSAEEVQRLREKGVL